jgi:hypothetical protein
MRQIKIFAPIFLLFFIFNLFFAPSALAQTTKNWSSISGGKCLGSSYGVTGANDVATIQGFECLFFNILQVITAVAGLAFFVMFISGGFNYLFSGNDDKKVAAASSTLTMAVIGLVGIIVSYFILRLIYNFTGVDVTNFVIPK